MDLVIFMQSIKKENLIYLNFYFKLKSVIISLDSKKEFFGRILLMSIPRLKELPLLIISFKDIVIL
jgi:hypothetical protein